MNKSLTIGLVFPTAVLLVFSAAINAGPITQKAYAAVGSSGSSGSSGGNGGAGVGGANCSIGSSGTGGSGGSANPSSCTAGTNPSPGDFCSTPGGGGVLHARCKAALVTVVLGLFPLHHSPPAVSMTMSEVLDQAVLATVPNKVTLPPLVLAARVVTPAARSSEALAPAAAVLAQEAPLDEQKLNNRASFSTDNSITSTRRRIRTTSTTRCMFAKTRHYPSLFFCMTIIRYIRSLDNQIFDIHL